MDFLKRLQVNAYSQLDVSTHEPDTHGWMDPNLADVVKRAVDGKSRTDRLFIIEVGTWKGRSAIAIASTLTKLGFLDFSVLCIDTWLGAPEFWTWGMDDPTRGGSLRLVNGYPSVFTTFTKNIKKIGLDDVIIPLPLSSIQAADVLKHYGMTADVIYVDGAHEYEPVKHDISAYWPLLKVGGTMVGDDYMGCWPGVMRAVDELGSSRTLNGVVWSIVKTT